MLIFFPLLFLLATLGEGTLTSLPLVLIVLLLRAAFRQDEAVFLYAFVGGLLLDIFLVRPLGETSVFLLIFIFFVFLYDRKYEIKTVFFILIAAAVGTVLYVVVFPSPQASLQVLTSVILAGIGFLLIQRLSRKKEKKW